MKKSSKFNNVVMIRQGILSLLLGAGLLVWLLYLSSICIVTQCIPQHAYVILGMISVCIAVAFSSMVFSVQHKTNILLCAGVCAGCFSLFLLAACSINGVQNMSSLIILRIISICISAYIGSAVGMRIAQKKRKSNRKRSYT